MKITFTSLSYFQKIAELQHMTRAAAALHVAQPSLSRTIKSLEEELDVPLFDHRGRNIVLTKYGEILLAHVNLIMKEMEAAKKELKEAEEAAHKTVKLSLYAASKLVPSFLMEFRKRHPDIRLEILLQGLQTEHHVGYKGCDLTLCSNIHPLDDGHSVTLFKEEIMLAVPDTDPHANMPSVNLSDFSESSFICLHTGQSLRTVTDYYCREAGFMPKVALESDSPETVQEFIRTGLGISFVPQITWGGVGGENVVLVPIASPRCYRYISLTWDKNRELPAPAAELKKFIIDHFADFAKSYAAKRFSQFNKH